MSKKISIADKRKILQEYEGGKPAIAFVNEYKCDIRTVHSALDYARRERDATFARSELMKEALHNHQKRLAEEMKRIIDGLEVPEISYAPLSWYEDDDSIFNIEKPRSKESTLGLSKKPGRPSAMSTTATDLLRQHLKSDPLWRLLVQNDKVHAAHINCRSTLQRMAAYLLEKNTGYKMSPRPTGNFPFFCSYIAGPAVYESCLRVALDNEAKEQFENELIADDRAGAIKYRNSILVEDPGNEEKSRLNIIHAYYELLKSPLLEEMKQSRKTLIDCCAKVTRAAEEIVLLGYIPGSCNSCRKLGM
jgi:hypothetical protein